MENEQHLLSARPRGADTTTSDELAATSDSENSKRVTKQLREATIEEASGDIPILAPHSDQDLSPPRDGMKPVPQDTIQTDDGSRGRGLRRKRSHDEVEDENTEEVNGQKAGKHSRKRSRDGDVDARLDSDNLSTATASATDIPMEEEKTNGVLRDKGSTPPHDLVNEAASGEGGIVSPKNKRNHEEYHDEIERGQPVGNTTFAQPVVSAHPLAREGGIETESANPAVEPRIKRARDSPQPPALDKNENAISAKVCIALWFLCSTVPIGRDNVNNDARFLLLPVDLPTRRQLLRLALLQVANRRFLLPRRHRLLLVHSPRQGLALWPKMHPLPLALSRDPSRLQVPSVLSGGSLNSPRSPLHPLPKKDPRQALLGSILPLLPPVMPHHF